MSDLDGDVEQARRQARVAGAGCEGEPTAARTAVVGAPRETVPGAVKCVIPSSGGERPPELRANLRRMPREAGPDRSPSPASAAARSPRPSGAGSAPGADGTRRWELPSAPVAGTRPGPRREPVS